MSSTSSGAGSQQQPSSTMADSKPRSTCCSECNSQIWSSYVVGLLACLLVVGGIFLAFHRWDYLWLAVSAVGVLLILIGASLHYCGGGGAGAGAGGDRTASAAGEAGTRAQNRKRGSNHHRIVCDLGNQNERLLPSAPPSGISGSSGYNFSVSQLSLNALPPFFQSYDTVSLGTQVASSPTVGPPVSPIMHLNGQSFLLLPIGGSSAETASEANSLAQRLSTHLAVLEQQSLSQKRCPEAVNFGLVPCLTSFATSKDPMPQMDQPGLQVAFAGGKTETTAAIQELPSEALESVIAIPVEEVQPEEEEEPIYQVPRIPSAQATANTSQTDPNMCAAPVVEHSNVTTQLVAQIVSTQAIVESDLLEEPPPSNEQTALTTVIQEEEMPNGTAVPSDHVAQTNLSPARAEEIPTDTSASVPISIIVEEAAVQQGGDVGEEVVPNDLTLNVDSRVSTPEPNWTLPPSYEEVAPPNFKRLGHNKFAYETM